MLEQGVASAEDIDRAMELGYNHPMGPLRLSDLVGLDVRLAIADHLLRDARRRHLRGAGPAAREGARAASWGGRRARASTGGRETR